MGAAVRRGVALRLSILGTIHVNRRSVVAADLRVAAADADAICVEWPTRSARATLRDAARFPLALAGYALYSLLLGPLYLLFTRRPVSTERWAADAVADGRPVHTVDRSPFAFLAERDRWWAWSAGNWLGLAVTLAAVPLAGTLLGWALLCVAALRAVGRQRRRAFAAAVLAVGGGTAAVVWWLPTAPAAAGLLVPYLGLVATLGGTITDRDEGMVGDVVSLADEHGYEAVCLATGYAHVAGVVAAAREAGVEVAGVRRCRWLARGIDVPPREGNRFRAVMPAGRPATAGDVLGARLTAALVDWTLWAAVGLVAAALGAAPLAFVVWVVAGLAYHPACETRFGRSLGKRALGLTVVEADGDPPSRGAVLRRWLARPVDFLPVGFLAGLLSMTVDDDDRRLGDRWAGTLVVRAED